MTTADIPYMAKVQTEASLVDRQTILKGYGEDKYDMEKITLENAPGSITN